MLSDFLHDLETGLPALALGTLAVPNVRTVCTVNVSAVAASKLVDFLPVVSTRLSCIPDDNLAVGLVNVADFCRTFRSAHGFS